MASWPRFRSVTNVNREQRATLQGVSVSTCEQLIPAVRSQSQSTCKARTCTVHTVQQPYLLRCAVLCTHALTVPLVGLLPVVPLRHCHDTSGSIFVYVNVSSRAKQTSCENSYASMPEYFARLSAAFVQKRDFSKFEIEKQIWDSLTIPSPPVWWSSAQPATPEKRSALPTSLLRFHERGRTVGQMGVCEDRKDV